MASVRCVSEAIATLKGAREVLSRYKIRLHKIVASEPEVLAAFPSSETIQHAGSIDLCVKPEHGALGLVWNVNDDTLSIRAAKPRSTFTKRTILSVIQSVFDPLGFFSPIVLAGRLMQRTFIAPLQSASEFAGYGWDDPLPASHFPKWNQWMLQLPEMSSVSLPRDYSPALDDVNICELHMFSDASSSAIGFVGYLRRVSSGGLAVLGFVMGGSKVSPRKTTSIPRLELCAAVESALASRRILEEIGNHVDRVCCHTDSNVVLGYLRNKSRVFSRYVTARVRKILSCSGVGDWSFVPSDQNPADIACRPHTLSELKRSIWWSGPDFLRAARVPEFHFKESLETLPETKPVSQCLFTRTPSDYRIMDYFRD